MVSSIVLPTLYSLHQIYSQPSNKVLCASDASILTDTIATIESNIIVIEDNGDIVG
jgi:hypothetical protein